jgi:hypothetical protein
MKVIFGLIFISCFVSCKYNKDLGRNVDSRDTTCIKELEEAEQDFEANKLTYCHYIGNIIRNDLRSEKEMTQLLKKYNIDLRNEGSPCIVYEDQSDYCYCDFMESKIKKRFGEKFIDSLLVEADKLYLKNNIDSTFNYFICDSRPMYPGDNDSNQDEQSDILQKEVDASLVYPKGYAKRPNYDVTAFANVYFDVDQQGNAEITNIGFTFDNEANEKYIPYLKKEITSIIKTKGWMPATIRGVKVKSDMVLRVYLE